MNKWINISIIVVLVAGFTASLFLYFQESSNLGAAEGQIDTLEGNVSNLEGIVSSLETDLAVEEAEVSRLEGELATAKTEVSRLDGELVTEEAEVSRLEGELATAKTEVSRLEGELTAAEAQVSTLETDLVSAEAQVSTLETDLVSAEAHVLFLESLYRQVFEETVAVDNFNGTWKGTVFGPSFRSDLEIRIEGNNAWVVFSTDRPLTIVRLGPNLILHFMAQGGIWTETQVYTLASLTEDTVQILYTRQVHNEGDATWSIQGSGILTRQ